MWQNDQLDLAGLRQLKRDAEILAVELSAAAEAAGGQFTGRDPARVVELTVLPDGTPTQVDVVASWRQTVGDRGLGQAIVAALSDAAAARITAWGEFASADSADQPVPDSGLPADRGAELGDPSSRQSMHALRDLFDLIGEATAGLHGLAEAAEAAGPVTSTNLSRTVTVTATNGQITGVDFDPQWLRTAPAGRIAEAVGQALTASVRDAAAARQARLDAVPGLGQIRRLTESPETLLREIGLLR